MRVDVLKAFIDKETGQGYNVGGTYSSDSDVRLTALANLGYTSKPPVSNLRSVRVNVDESAEAKAAKAPAKRTRAKAVKNDESDK